jgi:chromosome segregation ATPase
MDIKLNRMDVKPNRPVRVGNQMMRSGEGGTEFHEQVDAALAAASPSEDPVAQFGAEIGEALSTMDAKVDGLQTQLQEAVEQIADLVQSNAQLAADLVSATSTIATLSGQVASLQRAADAKESAAEPTETKAAADTQAAPPKSTEKAAKATKAD